MAENNQNQNNQNEENNNNNNQNQNNQNNSVDVEKTKADAIAEYLKEIGVESDEDLKSIVQKQRDADKANKTELENANDENKKITKKLSEEKEARILAEAKLTAIKLGAKADMVDDLVIVAKSKVTKEKDIDAVIAEIKDSSSGKAYFADENEEQKKSVVTRKSVNNNNNNKNNNNDGNNHEGTIASRLFANKKQTKSHYFK